MTRILTFDGGGICGVLTATLLKRLDTLHPGLIARTQLFAGTSTGGIIALCLAAGVPIDTIIALYRDSGGKIFDQSTMHVIETVDGLFGATYRPDNLHALLIQTLGTITMEQLHTEVMIPTFRLDNGQLDPRYRRWQAQFFTRRNVGVLASDVAMMTSAAPTYFPTYMGHVDGGLVQNNPSMLANVYADDPTAVLLSLGTSQTMTVVKGDTDDLGDIGWLRHGIIGGFMQGASDAADFMCQFQMEDRYRRINPGLQPGQDIGMDEYRAVQTLIDLGAGCELGDVEAWLTKMGW